MDPLIEQMKYNENNEQINMPQNQLKRKISLGNESDDLEYLAYKNNKMDFENFDGHKGIKMFTKILSNL